MREGKNKEGDVQSAVKQAADARVRIYTVGIGTAEGAPIPLRDEYGKMSGYKKDRAGEVVITKLNADLMVSIAAETGGIYAPASPGEQEIDWIYDHMQDLEKREFRQRVVVERENHFQLFLGIALILIMLEATIGEVKRGNFARVQ